VTGRSGGSEPFDDRPPSVGTTVAVVPAKDRADTVGDTVRALLGTAEVAAVVVVDDGSEDDTAALASAAGARVVRLGRNVGKGGAVAAGVAATGSPARYLLVDADLGCSAARAAALVAPVAGGVADMSIAVFPAHGRSQGFGVVKRAAAAILFGATGRRFEEPLSGQRCVRGALMRSLRPAPRFGLEVGLTLDVLQAGGRVLEMPIELEHRPTGRDLAGVRHRARQGVDLLTAAAARHGWCRTLRWTASSLRRSDRR
jgi:hypothetical protein